MSEIESDMPESTEPAGEGSRFAKAHNIMLLFVIGVLVVWILSGFYQVKANQIAIVERLGQFVANAEGKAILVEHGLHYHLPWPIDRIHVISTQQQFTMPVTTFNTSPEKYAAFKLDYLRRGWQQQQLDAIYDPYLLTGDKCVIHMDITVQFHIDDPQAWLTSVSHDYSTLYDAAGEGDMRNQLFLQIAQRALVANVGKMPLESVLRDGREELQNALLRSLQEAMTISDAGDATGGTKLSLGAQILKVQIGNDKVPDRVGPAYENLNKQRAMADAVRNQAKGDANAATIKADGEKTTLIVNAKNYAQSTVQAAKGDASRFGQILEQYYTAPDVTRWTIYSEAVGSVAGNAKRILFAAPGQPTIITINQPEIDTGQLQPRQP